MKNFSRLIILALAVTFVTGCGTYRLVEVKVDSNLKTNAEITAVPNIAARVSNYRNVVISYSKEFYSPDTDTGKNSGSVLLSGNGIWITEIEREFIKKGFRVLSREKYNELVREKGVDKSRNAATLLGADMIIQINSLEYSKDASIVDRTEYIPRNYVSSSSGTKEFRALNTAKNREAVEKALNMSYNDVNTGAFTALLDCKIIDAKTGELILFYRNQLFKLKTKRSPSVTVSYLFSLDDEDKWVLEEVFGLSEDDFLTTSPTKRGINRTREQQIKIEMVRKICSDLVNRLSSFRKTGSSSGRLSNDAQVID